MDPATTLFIQLKVLYEQRGRVLDMFTSTASCEVSLTVLQGDGGAVHRLALGWGAALGVGGGAGAGDVAAAEAGAQLQAPHVANHCRCIESLLQTTYPRMHHSLLFHTLVCDGTHPPLAFGKVFPHLSADRLVDVLAESRVSSNPERFHVHPFRSCQHNSTHVTNVPAETLASQRRFFEL